MQKQPWRGAEVEKDIIVERKFFFVNLKDRGGRNAEANTHTHTQHNEIMGYYVVTFVLVSRQVC